MGDWLTKLFFALMMIKASDSVPLYGNSTLGYYYVKAFIGTPPQVQTMIFDTGSHLTLTVCEKCEKCGRHSFPKFSPTSSSTCTKPTEWSMFQCSRYPDPISKEKCAFSISYIEGSSYHGYFVEDEFSLEDSEDWGRVVFGCITKETGLFYTQEAEGIIGIASNPFEEGERPPNPLETAIINGKTNHNRFFLCISPNGGVLNFEDWNYSRHTNGKIQRLQSSSVLFSTQYRIVVSGLMVGGYEINFNWKNL